MSNRATLGVILEKKCKTRDMIFSLDENIMKNQSLEPFLMSFLFFLGEKDNDIVVQKKADYDSLGGITNNLNLDLV